MPAPARKRSARASRWERHQSCGGALFANKISNTYAQTMSRPDAVVVGSGPNGLAAAIVIARTGRRVVVFEAEATIGGGVRSAELTLPGFVHDLCSAVHPLAIQSPLFRTLPLEAQGLQWIAPPVMLAHPLDEGSAAAIVSSVHETAAALGAD